MFQLIIVDDESLAIKAIRTCIDWSNMGVARIFTANSARQAKEIFRNNRIDIMLCDIEMPQENGLELLAWVKLNYPETETIIQSCHSDFKYAKKAMQLESVDYILKPVLADDLENAVRKAIEKVELNRKSSSHRQASECSDALTVLPDILKYSDNIDNLFLQKTIENHSDTPYDSQVLPVLVVTRQSNARVMQQPSEVMKTLMPDLGCIGSQGIKLIELDNNVHLILLLNWQSRDDKEKVRQIFESALQTVYNTCGFELMCSIGSKVSFDELIPVIKRLLFLCRSNISNMSCRVYLLNEEPPKRDNYVTPDISYWAMLLDAGLNNKLLGEVTSFFSGIPDALKNDTYYLKEIREDFLQMLFTALKQKGVQAHQLFCDNLSSGFFDKAPYSVNNMIAWIEHVVARSSNITQVLSKEQSIVEKSIRYIKLHIDQDIKREDVSNYVYLNPDYLTRIFKKETGMSITECIINERVKIAKKLLENTDMPVSSIALRVGYTNFSHFSKMFRKHVGMNPVDFKNSFICGLSLSANE